MSDAHDSYLVDTNLLFYYCDPSDRRKHLLRDARAAVEGFVHWTPVNPGTAAFRRALHWCDRAGINFWDGLILAAAEQTGSRWLLSEDFQSGRKFGGVSMVNPFERSPRDCDLA